MEEVYLLFLEKSTSTMATSKTVREMDSEESFIMNRKFLRDMMKEPIKK